MKLPYVFKRIKIRFLIEIRAIKNFISGICNFYKAIKDFEKSLKELEKSLKEKKL